MTSKATTPDEYILEIPAERQILFQKLRETILKNLPKGFHEEMSYGMIGYLVPKSIYPAGYHCNPKLPLPFLAIASQKNFVAIYHMGIYLEPALLEWFVAEFPKHSKKKLDLGKSCLRFKQMEDIPFDFIGELVAKMSVARWIELYESVLLKKK
jgi:Domain of unknown function (DU1801)